MTGRGAPAKRRVRVSRVLACGLSIGSACASTAWSQIRLYQISGEENDLRLGATVAAAGDIDLDGVPDFVVGSAPWLSSHYGQVQLVSGRTGTILRTLGSNEPDDGFGRSAKVVGDLDGDGVPDVVVGAPTADAHGGSSQDGLVRAFSCRTGALLWVARAPDFGISGFGLELAGVGDMDGDGIADVAVGTCIERLSGFYVTAAVRVLSGRDGSLVRVLLSCTCAGGAGGFGLSIAGPGDVDGDGTPDVLVGAPLDWWNGAERGSAYLFSGRTGTILRMLRGPSPGSRLGTVAALGDVDHDGWPDYAIGAARDPANGAGAGSVTVYSGVDGSVLRVLYGNAGDEFGGFLAGGGSLSGGGDVDGDGYPDLAVGAVGTLIAGFSSGDVRVFSLRSGAILAEIPAQAAYESVGPCAFIGDVNGDGSDDLVVGAPAADDGGADAGSARAYLLGHDPPISYCIWKWNSQNCASTPACDGAPSLAVGNGLLLRAGGVLNHRPGYLVWGLARAHDPFGGGSLCVQPLDRGPLQDAGGTPPPITDCTGVLTFRFTANYLATHGLGVGTRVFCQFLSRDDGFAPPNNIGLSDGLAFTVIP